MYNLGGRGRDEVRRRLGEAALRPCGTLEAMLTVLRPQDPSPPGTPATRWICSPHGRVGMKGHVSDAFHQPRGGGRRGRLEYCGHQCVGNIDTCQHAGMSGHVFGAAHQKTTRRGGGTGRPAAAGLPHLPALPSDSASVFAIKISTHETTFHSTEMACRGISALLFYRNILCVSLWIYLTRIIIQPFK